MIDPSTVAQRLYREAKAVSKLEALPTDTTYWMVAEMGSHLEPGYDRGDPNETVSHVSFTVLPDRQLLNEYIKKNMGKDIRVIQCTPMEFKLEVTVSTKPTTR